MFRIDDFDVVDATTSGNAARFINHSCDVSITHFIQTYSSRNNNNDRDASFQAKAWIQTLAIYFQDIV